MDNDQNIVKEQNTQTAGQKPWHKRTWVRVVALVIVAGMIASELLSRIVSSDTLVISDNEQTQALINSDLAEALKHPIELNDAYRKAVYQEKLEQKRKEVLNDLKFMDYAQVVFTSAMTGQRVSNILQAVQDAYTQASRRVSTGALNDVIGDAMISLQPPVMGGRRLKIYYATQQSVLPPTFILFVNHEELMHFSYQRYLENQIRKSFGFEGTPLRFILREKKKED